MLDKILQYPKLQPIKQWLDNNFPKNLRGHPHRKPINSAILLAAGRGVRMQNLTDTMPKPDILHLGVWGQSSSPSVELTSHRHSQTVRIVLSLFLNHPSVVAFHSDTDRNGKHLYPELIDKQSPSVLSIISFQSLITSSIPFFIIRIYFINLKINFSISRYCSIICCVILSKKLFNTK